MKLSKQIKTILWGTAIVSIIPPAFIFFREWFLHTQDKNLHDAVIDFLLSSLFSVTVTLSIFLTHFFIVQHVIEKLRKRLRAVKSFLLCMLITLISANIIIFILWEIFDALIFHNPPADHRVVVFQNQIFVTVLVIIVNLVFEVKHYIDQLKITLVEKERLEKQNILSQLETLKTQISPHFLFNSFNALLSLIDSDKQKAKDFVQELSKVYRYVLEHKNDLVVEVKDEITFIQSFIYLNKIRFGENLQFTTTVTAEVYKKYIPPLTLQLLVENAIKHNIISREKPLYIYLYTEAGSLILENDLQPRVEKIESTGLGLQNLKERYHLIYNIEPVFIIKDQKYIAKVPLIDKDQ